MELRTAVMAVAAAFLAVPAVAQECGVGERLFEHAVGATCVPEQPQRIVVLHDQNALLPLLELGITPVGSAGHVEDGKQVYRRTDGYDTTGVVFVGTYGEPDAEAVAALAPDLIVGAGSSTEQNEIFSRIAPTVHIDMFGQPMEAALMQFADLVGRTERAEALRDEFRAYADQRRSELGDKLGTTTVSVISYWDGQYYAMEPVQAFGLAYQALGFTRPAYEAALGEDREERSWEVLGDHEADVMVLVTYNDQGGEVANEFLNQPLVQLLEVSKAGQILPVDGVQMVGTAWGKARKGVEVFADIIADDGLNRELVGE